MIKTILVPIGGSQHDSKLCQIKSYRLRKGVRPTFLGSQMAPFGQSSKAPLFKNVAAG